MPAGLQVVRQPIGQLQGADLEKKLRLTENLGPTSPIDPAVRERAIAAAAGIPRLLERLDSLVGMDLGDLDARFAAIEADPGRIPRGAAPAATAGRAAQRGAAGDRTGRRV